MKIETGSYPSFPTDMQPQFTTLATKANGTSRIVDTIFEQRFVYTEELKAMGARISNIRQGVEVIGPTELQGISVEAKDLRGGAALVLAGLSARGTTCVNGVNHVNRGYEKIQYKLKKVGASIELVEEE